MSSRNMSKDPLKIDNILNSSLTMKNFIVREIMNNPDDLSSIEPFNLYICNKALYDLILNNVNHKMFGSASDSEKVVYGCVRLINSNFKMVYDVCNN